MNLKFEGCISRSAALNDLRINKSAKQVEFRRNVYCIPQLSVRLSFLRIFHGVVNYKDGHTLFSVYLVN